MKPELFAQLEFLRAHVESIVERSATIMITSAKDGDGKSLTAHGLAERLADTGRSVVLLSVASAERSAILSRGIDRVRAYPIVTLPLDEESSPIATTALRQSIDELRERFEYTIVDGAPLLRSRVSTLLASMVDAILVTVRLGRTSDGDDAALVDSLQRSDATVLGVVAVAAKDIAEFVGHAGTRHPGDAPAPIAKPNLPILDRAVRPLFEGLRR